MSPAGKTAIVAGATGLVGSALVARLLADLRYERVVVLGRRRPPQDDTRIVFQNVDFDRFEESAHLVGGDDVFCCVGTTIKEAGSPEAFRRVDLEIPRKLAAAAKAGGARKFLLVSSLGADAGSPLLYPKTKGEAEAAVAACGFTSTFLLRPSFLLGKRQRARPLEGLVAAVLTLLSPLLLGPLRRYRPIRAETVARAMVRAATSDLAGTIILESDRIAELARPDATP